jgi:hypothetical protein
VDEAGHAVGGHASLLAEGAQFDGEPPAAYERAGHVDLPARSIKGEY